MANPRSGGSSLTPKESKLLGSFVKNNENGVAIDWTTVAGENGYSDTRAAISAFSRLKDKLFDENSLNPVKIPGDLSEVFTKITARSRTTSENPKRATADAVAAERETGSKKATPQKAPTSKATRSTDDAKSKVKGKEDVRDTKDDEEVTEVRNGKATLTKRTQSKQTKQIDRRKRPSEDKDDDVVVPQFPNESTLPEAAEGESGQPTKRHGTANASSASGRKRKGEVTKQEPAKKPRPNAKVVSKKKGDTGDANAAEVPEIVVDARQKAPVTSKIDSKDSNRSTPMIKNPESDATIDSVTTAKKAAKYSTKFTQPAGTGTNNEDADTTTHNEPLSDSSKAKGNGTKKTESAKTSVKLKRNTTSKAQASVVIDDHDDVAEKSPIAGKKKTLEESFTTKKSSTDEKHVVEILSKDSAKAEKTRPRAEGSQCPTPRLEEQGFVGDDESHDEGTASSEGSGMGHAFVKADGEALTIIEDGDDEAGLDAPISNVPEEHALSRCLSEDDVSSAEHISNNDGN